MDKKIKIISLTKGKLKEKFEEFIEIDRLQMEGFEKWQRKNFFLELPLKFQLSCLAENKDQVVGYNIVSRKNNLSHIHRIVVHPDFTGQGIGSKMLKFSQIKAQERALKKMVVETSRKKNLQKFYLKNNFKKMTNFEQKKYVQNKPVSLQKIFLKKYFVFYKYFK
ncbi:MAG: GNAT family N-acetyltransferase [Patescibacteria group bacterium]